MKEITLLIDFTVRIIKRKEKILGMVATPGIPAPLGGKGKYTFMNSRLAWPT